MVKLIDKYLTKKASEDDADVMQTAMLKFKPATELELKAIGDTLPDGYVAGWASTPDLDSYRHVVAGGAFSDAIKKRGLVGPEAIKLLVGHKWDKVAGVIKVLEYRGDRLWIEAQLNLSLSYARDIYEVCKMLGGLNFSVGFMLEEYSFKEEPASKSEYLYIAKGDLFEVSIVAFPGNEDAQMEFVKNKNDNAPLPTTIAEFEKNLVNLGLAKSRNEARKITQAVKSSASLFKSDETTPAVVPAAEPKPMLAMETITELSALVAKMKNVLKG